MIRYNPQVGTLDCREQKLVGAGFIANEEGGVLTLTGKDGRRHLTGMPWPQVPAGTPLRLRMIRKDGSISEKTQRTAEIQAQGRWFRWELRVMGAPRPDKDRIIIHGYASPLHTGVIGKKRLEDNRWHLEDNPSLMECGLVGYLQKAERLWNTVAKACEETRRQCVPDTSTEELEAVRSLIIGSAEAYNSGRGKRAKLAYTKLAEAERPEWGHITSFYYGTLRPFLRKLEEEKSISSETTGEPMASASETLGGYLTSWITGKKVDYSPIRQFSAVKEFQRAAISLGLWPPSLATLPRTIYETTLKRFESCLKGRMTRMTKTKMSFHLGWPQQSGLPEEKVTDQGTASSLGYWFGRHGRSEWSVENRLSEGGHPPTWEEVCGNKGGRGKLRLYEAVAPGSLRSPRDDRGLP